MLFKIPNKVGASYKLSTKKSIDGQATLKAGPFCNMVTDAGIKRMGTAQWFDRLCVGTGSTIPTGSITELTAFKASTQAIISETPYIDTENLQPQYYGVKVVYRYAKGAAAGEIKELGFAWADDKLFNYALTKDTAGTPITVHVEPDEFLEVECDLRIHLSPNITGAFELRDKDGELVSTHTYTGRPVITSGGALNKMGAISLEYDGLHSSGVKMSAMTEDNAAETGVVRLGTASEVSATDFSKMIRISSTSEEAVGDHTVYCGRIVGMLSDINGFKIQITPPIEKLDTDKALSNFEIQWGRYSG